MAARAGLFEEDFGVSAFAPKKADGGSQPPREEVRAVAEATKFQSREPIVTPLAAKPSKKEQPRRRRTGSNMKINLKVASQPLQIFYEISDRQGWVLGETFENAIQALQRELAIEK